MPIFKNKVLAGNQFTGATSADGLFDPAPGSDAIHVRINSLRYHTEGPGNLIELYAQDPDDASNRTLVLSQTAKDLYIDNLLLPTEEGSTSVAPRSWPLLVITTGQTLDSWVSIDYDFVPTES